MAHELQMLENGQASMAYAGEVPWHGLGFKVLPDLTPEQMLQAAHLDWTVEKVPLYGEYGGQSIDSGAQALIRTSDRQVLTIVTDHWNPVQNSEAFEFFNDFIGAGEMEMHTAGSLKGGRMVWALAKLKDKFELFGSDVVEGYMLFSNPHQFGRAIDVRFTPTRVVCNNTLTMALTSEAKHRVSVNHRSQFNPDTVKRTLGIAEDKMARYKEMAEFLGQKRYTGENVVEYFNRIFPKYSDKKNAALENGNVPHSKAAKLATGILHTQPGAKFAEGSWWQAFNAVTFMTDHILGKSADTRLSSAWFGVNQQKKIQALNLAMQYADAAA